MFSIASAIQLGQDPGIGDEDRQDAGDRAQAQRRERTPAPRSTGRGRGTPSNSRRVRKRKTHCGTMLRAPRKPSGSDETTASIVPRYAIATVSTIERSNSAWSQSAKCDQSIISRRMTQSFGKLGEDPVEVEQPEQVDKIAENATASAARMRAPARWANARGKRLDRRPMSAAVMRSRRIAPLIVPAAPMNRCRIRSEARSIATTISRIRMHDRADLLIDVEADHALQFLADAAGTDKADDRRGPHVDLEPQQRVAEEARQHLRHDPVAHLLPTRCRRRRGYLRPRRRSAFSFSFRKQLAQGSGGVDADGEDARQRADPKRPDQDESQHDLRDRCASPPAAGG